VGLTHEIQRLFYYPLNSYRSYQEFYTLKAFRELKENLYIKKYTVRGVNTRDSFALIKPAVGLTHENLFPFIANCTVSATM
jgi:hypothetical protein